jgi:uncharacterized protein YoaH (UPF0181 family)
VRLGQVLLYVMVSGGAIYRLAGAIFEKKKQKKKTKKKERKKEYTSSLPSK